MDVDQGRGLLVHATFAHSQSGQNKRMPCMHKADDLDDFYPAFIPLFFNSESFIPELHHTGRGGLWLLRSNLLQDCARKWTRGMSTRQQRLTIFIYAVV